MHICPSDTEDFTIKSFWPDYPFKEVGLKVYPNYNGSKNKTEVDNFIQKLTFSKH